VTRKALLVGISHYAADDFGDLDCCVDDARAMHARLAEHALPGTDRGNYSCSRLSSDENTVDLPALEAGIADLLQGDENSDALFYFSGHGFRIGDEAWLVTCEGSTDQPGYAMSRLLEAANRSRLRSVLIVLDCCHSGQIGNFTGSDGAPRVRIGPNVTVLAASDAYEKSTQGLDYSLFTSLLLDGLDGGAADLRGKVYAGALYAFVEQGLADWEQCPVYKSYSRRLNLVRECAPAISDALLARLPEWFAYPEMSLGSDAVVDEQSAFALLRNVGLVGTADDGGLCLTPRGRLCWTQAQRGEFAQAGAA